MQEAAKLGLDMTGVSILDPTDEVLMDEMSDDLVAARANKGMTKEAAILLLKDVNYAGTMLVRSGRMDGLVRSF